MPDDYEVFGERPLKKLICMYGLPRSGKSTVARELARLTGSPIVNRDSIRLALTGQRYQKLAEPMVRAFAIVMVRSLFKAGHYTVIVDETNVKRSTRDFWATSDNDWRTQFLVVPTPVDVCLKRALATEQDDLVPVITSMADTGDRLEDDEVMFEIESLLDIGTSDYKKDAARVLYTLQCAVVGDDVGGTDANQG